ncbi:MAG: signal peptidase I [Candidatus Magasanikbacteria bacterium]|nr:signal peptidase I [Candidatus Magasanikbacteria bacterium]
MTKKSEKLEKSEVEEDGEKNEDETLEDELDLTQEKSIFRKIGSFFLELIKIALLAGITIGVVRYFLFKPFYVKGQSMEPNFHERDYLIIDEISYRFGEPERGEVIVFKAPLDNEDFYLKRIIGLPGERVKVENSKIIVYNKDNPAGVVVDESYIIEETPGTYSVTLAEDQYFVMGDNRDESFDSRRFGPISEDTIVGKAWVRGWPFSRVSLFNTPKYNF